MVFGEQWGNTKQKNHNSRNPNNSDYHSSLPIATILRRLYIIYKRLLNAIGFDWRVMRQWRNAVRFWYGTRRRPRRWRTRLRPNSTSNKNNLINVQKIRLQLVLNVGKINKKTNLQFIGNHVWLMLSNYRNNQRSTDLSEEEKVRVKTT